MKKNVVFGLAVLAGFLVLLTSCGSIAPPANSGTNRVAWTNQTAVPGYGWETVGVVVVFPDAEQAQIINAVLMEEAKKLGADDIINVRLDTKVNSSGKTTILGATAVAIKYNDQLVPVTSAAGPTSGPEAPPEQKKKGLFGF